MKVTIENKAISVTTHCKKLPTENNLFIVCYYLQQMSHLAVFTSNVQCVRIAAGGRTQAGDATDQWRDQPNAATVCP